MKLATSNDGYVQKRVDRFCSDLSTQKSQPKLVLVYTNSIKLVAPAAGCHKCELMEWNSKSWGL